MSFNNCLYELNFKVNTKNQAQNYLPPKPQAFIAKMGEDFISAKHALRTQLKRSTNSGQLYHHSDLLTHAVILCQSLVTPLFVVALSQTT